MVINIHITPRERERLIREERQRRRVARILQVRQQADEQAQLLRENLRNEKRKKVEELRKELRRSVSELTSDIVRGERAGSISATPRSHSSHDHGAASKSKY
ncbi:unnamed protein product [Nippostrongylus brasiliensis]|uniref:Uncharacterized protein n=1 Tax=Nippostrongylus brasiliensis TaxID=27835 RepID=A0A0N4XZJ3_NIPBR|nr:unnamed protein product [Nippostrongylus brasiliensis]